MLLCKTAGCSHCRCEFYFSPIKYAILIPLVAQNYYHSHGNPMRMGIPIPMYTSSCKFVTLGQIIENKLIDRELRQFYT